MKDKMEGPSSTVAIFRILNDELGFCKVCARQVLRQLLDKHKKNCMAAVLTFLMRYAEEGEKMLNDIIKGDEIWVHHFTPTSKQATMMWKQLEEATLRKFKNVLSAGKVMCTIFCDRQGIIYEEYMAKERLSPLPPTVKH